MAPLFQKVLPDDTTRKARLKWRIVIFCSFYKVQGYLLSFTNLETHNENEIPIMEIFLGTGTDVLGRQYL